MRYLCTACGRFWHTEGAKPHHCPYCHSVMMAGGIKPKIPPALYNDKFICSKCGTQFIVEFSGDVKYCPRCDNNITGIEGQTLMDYQLDILSECDIL